MAPEGVTAASTRAGDAPRRSTPAWVVAALSVLMATTTPGAAYAESDQASTACQSVITRANIKTAYTRVHDTRVTNLRVVDDGRHFSGTADVLIFGESIATVWVRADACIGGPHSSATARSSTSWVAIQEGNARGVDAGSRGRARKDAVARASGQARRELRAIAIRRATRAAAKEALAESAAMAGRG